MHFKEVEFKYKADNITLSRFKEFCEGREPKRVVTAAGFDHFYENPKNPASFFRYRAGADTNQLTFKQKNAETNNFIRDETNLNLALHSTRADVESICSKLGYAHNFSLFKNCFVYEYDYYTLVYYICYDLDMKELGRFVEIEMSETYPWGSEPECYESLVALERLCKPLGITPHNRVRKSLYEMYREQKNA